MDKDEIDRLWDELGEDMVKALAKRLKTAKLPADIDVLLKQNKAKNTLDLEDTLRHLHEHIPGLQKLFVESRISNALENDEGPYSAISVGVNARDFKLNKKDQSEAMVVDILDRVNVKKVKCGDSKYAQKYWGSVIVEIIYEQPDFANNIESTMNNLNEVINDCSCFIHEDVDDTEPSDGARADTYNDVDEADTTVHAAWVMANEDVDYKRASTKVFTTWKALDEWIEKVSKALAPITKVLAEITKDMPTILDRVKDENEKFKKVLKEHHTFETELRKRMYRYEKMLATITEGIDIKEI